MYSKTYYQANKEKIAERNKTLNIFIAEDMLIRIKELEEAKASGEETTTTTTDLTNVKARPPRFGGGAAAKQERDAWDAQYGDTHFNDGTLMSPAQQEAWKESQAKRGGGKSKNSIRRLID